MEFLSLVFNYVDQNYVNIFIYNLKFTALYFEIYRVLCVFHFLFGIIWSTSIDENWERENRSCISRVQQSLVAHAVEMQRLTRKEARFVAQTEYLEIEDKETSYWLQTILCLKKMHLWISLQQGKFYTQMP